VYLPAVTISPLFLIAELKYQQRTGYKINAATYSGRKIFPSLCYVTVRGEWKMKRARGSKMAKSVYTFYRKHFSPF
jgi:hypothetical protein